MAYVFFFVLFFDSDIYTVSSWKNSTDLQVKSIFFYTLDVLKKRSKYRVINYLSHFGEIGGKPWWKKKKNGVSPTEWRQVNNWFSRLETAQLWEKWHNTAFVTIPAEWKWCISLKKKDRCFQTTEITSETSEMFYWTDKGSVSNENSDDSFFFSRRYSWQAVKFDWRRFCRSMTVFRTSLAPVGFLSTWHLCRIFVESRLRQYSFTKF